MKRPLILTVLQPVWNSLAYCAVAVVTCFMVRRWLFLLVAQFSKTRTVAIVEDTAVWPTVLLLVSFRNEAAVLPDLLSHLNQLTYPTDRLTIVLIDDGSTDGSPCVAQDWVSDQPHRHLLTLEQTVGKASALNAALVRFPQGELVAVYDADERPTPTTLSQLVACFINGKGTQISQITQSGLQDQSPITNHQSPFSESQLGAVSGRRTISNPLASLFASVNTIESLVHQLVTMRAKEWLALAPAILGSNCVYRRRALLDVGCFRPGALLEDSHLSLKLVTNGWQTRFCPQAISTHAVPQTLRGHWQQHSRWSSGFRNVAQQQARQIVTNQQLPWRVRLELLAFSVGYADRVAWLVMGLWVGAKTLITRRPPLLFLTVLLISLITPLLQVIVALRQGQASAALWWRVLLLPFMLPLDIAISLLGLLQKRTHWEAREKQ